LPESGVNLAFGASLQDLELHPLRARRLLHVSNVALDIHQHGHHPGQGTNSDSSSSRLGISSRTRMLKPVIRRNEERARGRAGGCALAGKRAAPAAFPSGDLPEAPGGKKAALSRFAMARSNSNYRSSNG